MAVAGCDRSKSSADAAGSSGGDGGATATLTGVEREAADAAFAEVAKHCVKSGDGWITARISGSPGAPEHFLRQYRIIEVESVTPETLDDADRLNGVEWRGTLTFKKVTAREAGEPGPAYDGMVGVNRQRGQWSEWFTCMPETVSLAKTRSVWAIRQDNLLFRGDPPTPQDYANAGVK